MSQKKKNAITPTREEDYPQWYQEVVKAADLAENSPVRGCMVIKPWGYAIWEKIKDILNSEIKKRGVQNAYFPLFIPLSFFQKEADHVAGFAKECAVVTHHKLEADKDNKLQPAGELDEPLIVRPTSEMMIGAMFSKWIESYRDLPLKINQWANIVRWELRTRMFLRTTEFLWQEGHTAHATKEEAEKEALDMVHVYKRFCEDVMAMPVIIGKKSESERFPGAVVTFALESMMQDRKALQAGTTHFLGQNFAKSCDIVFEDKEGESVHAWTTSWGVATRLIGSMTMIHSDDDGLVVPPKIAPEQIVILPVMHKEATRAAVLEYCHKLAEDLREKNVSVVVDEKDIRGGEKKWGWIKKGIPLWIEIGARDIETDTLFIGQRHNMANEKQKREEFIESINERLDTIQKQMFEKALNFQRDHTKKIDTKEDFIRFFTPTEKNKPHIHGGFALCHWCEDPKVEEEIKKDLGVTIRVIPFDSMEEEGKCIYSGKPSKRRVIFAKAY